MITASISERAKPAVNKRGQFTLLQMLRWVTYVAITIALWQIYPWFSLLFVAWVIPGVSRYMAMLRVRDDLPNYRHPVSRLSMHGVIFLGSVVVESGLSILSGMITTMFCIPIGFCTFVIARIVNSFAVMYVLQFLILLGIFAIYIIAHVKLRQWTWPEVAE